MYYRNANCAVVVYDITQAVRSSIISARNIPLTHTHRHPWTRQRPGSRSCNVKPTRISLSLLPETSSIWSLKSLTSAPFPPPMPNNTPKKPVCFSSRPRQRRPRTSRNSSPPLQRSFPSNKPLREACVVLPDLVLTSDLKLPVHRLARAANVKRLVL